MEPLCGRIAYAQNGRSGSLDFAVDAWTHAEDLVLQARTTRVACGTRLSIVLVPPSPVVVQQAFIRCRLALSDEDRIFLNGYQSWSEAREYRIDEVQLRPPRILRPAYGKYRLELLGDYRVTPYGQNPGHLRGYTYSYVRRAGGAVDFLGSLCEHTGFTVFEFDPRCNCVDISRDCVGLVVQDEYQLFDLLLASGSDEAVFDAYRSELGVPSANPPVAAGWTSWYQYGTGVSHDIISASLRALRECDAPVLHFQVDDGWEAAVGDWFQTNERFPKGMAAVAGEVSSSGFVPGLWLAPFICQESSQLAREHPDWLVSDGKGEPLKVGYNDDWANAYYALDFYRDEVREYLAEVLRTVLVDWGFELLKLDFLYAVCVKPGPNRTRGQVMSEAMRFLRARAGHKLVLGCGVPLGSAFGLVDYCRVGSDVDSRWDRTRSAAIHYRERISTINSLVSMIGRWQLDGRLFGNDPDVFILRRGVRLSDEQRRTLFLAGQIFGRLAFTSDTVDEYGEEARRLYDSQFPLVEKRVVAVAANENAYHWSEGGSIKRAAGLVRPYENLYTVRFEIGQRQYVAYLNLGSRVVGAVLDEGVYFDNRHEELLVGGSEVTLPPYGSVCLARYDPRPIALVGSTGHLFSGCDIRRFRTDGHEIAVEIEPRPARRSVVYFSIPDAWDGARVNGVYAESLERSGVRLVRVELGEGQAPGRS